MVRYDFCLQREKLYEFEQRLIPYEQKENQPDYEEDIENNTEAEMNKFQSYNDSLDSEEKSTRVLKIDIELVCDTN